MQHRQPADQDYFLTHKPNAEEVAPRILPAALENIIFGYTTQFDSEAQKETEGHDFPNMPTKLQSAQFTLFGRPFFNLDCTAVYSAIHAMFHDDQTTFSRIIDSNPECLFKKLEDVGITEYQSQYTWLRYLTKGETLFSIAQKLQWVDMVKIMRPHYLKALDEAIMKGDQFRINELENAWVMRVSTEQEQKALQEKYTNELILPVITALAADTTIQADWVQNPETGLSESTIKNASEATLTALKTLRDKLFEPKAIKDCIDVDQLLIAAYNAYDNKYYTFRNWAERDAYAVWVIGGIQSLADPRLGKIFSQGLYDVINNNQQIGDQAKLFKLADGRPFYRTRENAEGDFTFFCCIYGGVGLGRGGVTMAEVGARELKKYVEQRQKSVLNLCGECSSIAARRQQSNRGA